MPIFDELYKPGATPAQTHPAQKNGQAPPQIDPDRIMRDFAEWRRTFQGDPAAELQKLMDSGKVPAPMMRLYQMFARFYTGGRR